MEVVTISRKQKFKGKTLFKTRVVNHIVKVYNDDTFDFSSDWYENTSTLAKSMSAKYGVDYLKVCGIITALSPLKSWAENQKIANTFLANRVAKHTGLLRGKAEAILNNVEKNEAEAILRILNGNKIQNFFLNIAFPKEAEAVTIDRHALSICLNRRVVNKEGIGVTDRQYNFFASCYVEASKLLNVRPSQVQSVTWEKWRALKNIDTFSDVPF